MWPSRSSKVSTSCRASATSRSVRVPVGLGSMRPMSCKWRVRLVAMRFADIFVSSCSTCVSSFSFRTMAKTSSRGSGTSPNSSPIPSFFSLLSPSARPLSLPGTVGLLFSQEEQPFAEFPGPDVRSRIPSGLCWGCVVCCIDVYEGRSNERGVDTARVLATRPKLRLR